MRNAEAHAKVMAWLKTASPAEIFELSIKAGIYDPDGSLNRNYKPEPVMSPALIQALTNLAEVIRSELAASYVPGGSDSIWARIESARRELGWSESRLSAAFLGGRTQYTTVKNRGFKSHTATRDALVEGLVALGFSRDWLLLGRGPTRQSSQPDASATEPRPPAR